jgi:hypothetical protein
MHQRQEPAVQVRVVGVWAPRQSKSWWLATNLATPLVEIVALYDRRMAIAQAPPRVRLPCKRKGPRLSLLRVGM